MTTTTAENTTNHNELINEFILVEPPNIYKSDIEELIGTKINNIEYYQTAFTHKSALKKYKINESFETLEFMGDSVLGFVITKFLFDRYKDRQEGFLTKARTKLVRGETLANIARKLNLDKWVLMDDKGMRNGWNKNTKVLEDVFEALLGAIYMDIGLIHTKTFILKLFNDKKYVDLDCIMIDDNYKDRLMRYCQTNKFDLPDYKINYHQHGTFKVSVFVKKINMGSGIAKNKKQAEQNAAQKALEKLNEM
jgi:ribonuclease-3